MTRFICLLFPSVLLVGLSTDLAIAQPGGEKRSRDFMSFIDRNKNGVIEPEEFDKIPGRFKETLESFGVDTSRSMTRQEFEKVMPKIMERMRSRRGSSGSDGRQQSGTQPGQRIEMKSGGDSGSKRARYGSFRSSQSTAPQASTGKGVTSSSQNSSVKKVRTTVDLNQEFIPHDSDKDGQIGLYEWRAKNPTKLGEFFVMDLNGDGYLTPREIQLSKNGKPQRSAASFMFALNNEEETKTKPETEKPQTNTKEVKPSASVNKTVAASNDPLVNQAKYFFKLLDRNKDQMVSSKEWKKSRSMRRMFEGANIDLSQTMTQEQFVKHYLAIKKN